MRVERPQRAALGAALVVGLIVYLAALVAWAPAGLAGAILRNASNGRVTLAVTQGTLWSGSGRIRAAAGRASLSRQVVWRLAPFDLLRGRLRYEIQAGSEGPFDVYIGPRRIDIDRLELHLPAAALSAALPRMDALGLTGEVRVFAPQLAINYRGGLPLLVGGVNVQWLDAGSKLSPLSPFGAYALALQADSARVRVRISTLKGPLELLGQGEWENGKPPALQASLSVPEDRRDQFAPFLRMFAVEKAPGHFDLPLR